MKVYLLISILFSCFFVTFSQSIQNKTAIAYFSGAGSCDVCMDSSSYIISDSTDWGNGTSSFLDPIGSNGVVTSITVYTTYMFCCTDNASPVSIYIAGTLIGSVTPAYDCSCISCPDPYVITSNIYTNGFPGYNYNFGNNLISVELEDSSDVIGLGALTVVLNYKSGNVPPPGPPNPPPPGPPSNLYNTSVVVPYIGCGLCVLCDGMNYSLSNGGANCGEGIWDQGYRTFNDPIPKGGMLVQVEVVTTETFWCEAPVKVSFSLNSQDIGDHYAPYSHCGCDSCPDVKFITSDVYSNGFPGYKYGHQNGIQAFVSTGVLGIKEIELILTYSM